MLKGYFSYTGFMSTSLKRCRKESVNHRDSGSRVYEAAGKHEHVGIVVLTRQSCEFGSPAERSPDALMLVKRHSYAVTCAAYSYTGIADSAFDSGGEGMCIVRIVATLIAVGAKINITYTLRDKVSLDDGLQFKSGMIAAKTHLLNLV